MHTWIIPPATQRRTSPSVRARTAESVDAYQARAALEISCFFRKANWRYAQSGTTTLACSHALASLFFYFVQHQEPDMRIGAGMKTLSGIVVAIAMLGAAPARAQAGAEKPVLPMGLSKGDQKIVIDLAQADMAAIECAKVAQKKAQDETAKDFAQQMFADHSKALADVQQLASSKRATMPTAADKQQKEMIDKLSAMSGEAFDKAFIAQCGVNAHKKMRSTLASARKKAQDPDLKALATRLEPVVEQHLKEAQQMGSTKDRDKREKVEKYPVGV